MYVHRTSRAHKLVIIHPCLFTRDAQKSKSNFFGQNTEEKLTCIYSVSKKKHASIQHVRKHIKATCNTMYANGKVPNTRSVHAQLISIRLKRYCQVSLQLSSMAKLHYTPIKQYLLY